MHSYVLCVRNAIVDPDTKVRRFSTGMGKTTYLQIPWADGPDEIPGNDVPLPAQDMGKIQAWLRAITEEATSGRADGQPVDIVFFVHGYNTDSEEALKRQRLVERELHKRTFPCVVVGFDWPTGGTAVAYEYDRVQASQAALTLVKEGIIPFAKFSTNECPIRIHVMAHSMGAYVIREAFRSADKAHLAEVPNDWRVGQMVLLAGDVSSECFALGHPDMDPVFAHCGRLTNYFSGYDKALAVSNVKNLDMNARVGRVGMPEKLDTPGKAVDVDCGPRYQQIEDVPFKIINGMHSHSWYLEDGAWMDDLAHSLRGELDRTLIPTRVPAASGMASDFVLLAQ